ncbi:hypothetical protein SEA_MISCHIEF19_44 [Streptomyces phage Mischief19]|nr:hypothetical protein SEA_MISCHIEF19_44 [Streptomyces phage Mischief19]
MIGNNCTNPPHFPPHCGCPAGVAPAPAGATLNYDCPQCPATRATRAGLKGHIDREHAQR